MSTRKKNRRTLRLESLESRTLLAGNVLAALNAGTGILTLTGDAKGNGIAITTGPASESDPTWTLFITGTDTTGIATRVNPKSTKVNIADSISFPAANVKGIVVDMKDGRNEVTINAMANLEGGSLPLSKDLTLKSGKDVDYFQVQGLAVGGKLTVSAGAGADQLLLGPFAVTGAATIDAGAGGNYVYLGGGFDSSVSIKSTTGRDGVELNANIAGSLTIDTGTNDDYVYVGSYVPGSEDPATIGGNVTIKTGAGESDVGLGATVNGSVSVTGGNDYDYVGIYSGNIEGNLDVKTLGGGDYVDESSNVGGNVTVDSGTESDCVRVGGYYTYWSEEAEDYLYAAYTVGGNVTIKAGEGENNSVTVGGDVNGSVNVTGGRGGDSIAVQDGYGSWEWSEETYDWVYTMVVSYTVNGDVTVKAGEGNNGVSVGANVNGNVSLTGGNGYDYAEVYSANVGGSVDIKTLGGDDSVDVGSWDPEAPSTIGGSLAIDTGAGDDWVDVVYVSVGPEVLPTASKPARKAALAAGDVKISTGEGGELQRSWDEEAQTPFEPTEMAVLLGVSATGSLTVDGGNGDNGIVLAQCDAAHATLTTGKGSSMVGVGQLNLNDGAGTLDIKGGVGDNAVAIGTQVPEFLYWYEYVGYDFALEYGVMAGSVAINTGSVDSGEIAIENSFVAESVAINVKGGDVNIAIRNLQGLPIVGGFGVVANVAIQTDKGDDRIAIGPLEEGDFGLKATNLRIVSGAGNDTVAVDAVTADQALVDLGAGDDALAAGELNVIAAASANGGAGIDAFEGPEGWTLSNFEA